MEEEDGRKEKIARKREGGESMGIREKMDGKKEEKAERRKNRNPIGFEK